MKGENMEFFKLDAIVEGSDETPLTKRIFIISTDSFLS